MMLLLPGSYRVPREERTSTNDVASTVFAGQSFVQNLVRCHLYLPSWTKALFPCFAIFATHVSKSKEGFETMVYEYGERRNVFEIEDGGLARHMS